MKATIEIPDELYRQAKTAAATRGIKLRDLVVEGNRPARKRLEFPLIHTGEPGTLNIPDDVAAQVDALEDRTRYKASL